MPEAVEKVEEQDKPKPQAKPQAKRIAVRVIESAGQSALVEWIVKNDLCRAFVPLDKVEGDKVPEDVLAAGIPYGVPWEELIDLSGVTPEAIAREMRRRNLWRAIDVETNPAAASNAILAVIGISVASLRRAARQLEKQED